MNSLSQPNSQALSHTDADGNLRMVDVADKPTSIRTARAEGFITLNASVRQLVAEDRMKKGAVGLTAELAGIAAAKECAHLIPLCHNIVLEKIDVRFTLTDTGAHVTSFVKSVGHTGAEMEALTAVSVALLTVYDMCKAVDKEMVLSEIHLIEKHKEPILCA